MKYKKHIGRLSDLLVSKEKRPDLSGIPTSGRSPGAIRRQIRKALAKASGKDYRIPGHQHVVWEFYRGKERCSRQAAWDSRKKAPA